MSKLKACPFCGGKRPQKYSGTGLGDLVVFRIRCRVIACPVWPQTNCYSTLEEAIEAWNTRKGPRRKK